MILRERKRNIEREPGDRLLAALNDLNVHLSQLSDSVDGLFPNEPQGVPASAPAERIEWAFPIMDGPMGANKTQPMRQVEETAPAERRTELFGWRFQIDWVGNRVSPPRLDRTAD